MTDEQIAFTMIEHGGGFVSLLGKLWWAGDPDNRTRIKATWPEYWERYRKVAEQQGEVIR